MSRRTPTDNFLAWEELDKQERTQREDFVRRICPGLAAAFEDQAGDDAALPAGEPGRDPGEDG